MTEVSAKLGKEGDVIKVNYPFLDATDLNGLAKNFTEAVVVAHAKSSMTVALQGLIRGLIKQEKSQAEIQKAISEWKPGMRTPGKSRMEKAEDLVGKMTDEEKRDLLKKLQVKG